MLLKLEPLRESSCKLCRSPQTSDSNELPPDSKTPTTFQMCRPTFRSAPNEQPGYRFKINLPMTTSFSPGANIRPAMMRSEEHTSELQSRLHLVCRLLLEKKNK